MSEPHSPSDARDPFVARALATLPVPDHAPDFWDRLEAALDDASSAISPDAGAVIVGPSIEALPQLLSLAEIIRPGDERVRERRGLARAARPLLAAAAIVLVIATVRLSVATDGDDAILQSATPSGAGSSGAGSTPGGLDSATTAVATDAQRAEAALASFLAALGAGRLDDAAALIGPRSKTYLIDQSGSVAAFLAEATEGFGAWATSTDRVLTSVEVAPGSMVVVADGTVASEGDLQRRIVAFPMTKAESTQTWLVDMWAFDPAVGGRLEVSAEAASNGLRELRVGEPVEVFAAAPGTVRFALPGRAPVDVVTVKRGAANVAAWTPTAADSGAARLLTVAFTSDGGRIFTALAVSARVS